MHRIALGAVVAFAALAVPVGLLGQRVAWESEAVFYGDNTEFFTPYRIGETIFGAHAVTGLRLATSERTEVVAGVFGNVRWGSDEFLDEVKPVLGFRYRSGPSTGVLGTLITERRHGFLDPLAVSTLELTRPVEYGMQWIERRRTWDVDAFINWQGLNTPTQRESFDYGWVLRVRPLRQLVLESQHRWLHRGGQLFDAGEPVTNNNAGAIGVGVEDTLGFLGLAALRVYRLWSAGHLDPDAPPGRPDRGRGTLVRASVRPTGTVEIFGMLWRGRDFLANEGDNNYNSVGAATGFYRARRKYLELGVARRGGLDGPVSLDAEFRLHRIDDESSVAFLGTSWEYSYRLVVRAPFTIVLRP